MQPGPAGPPQGERDSHPMDKGKVDCWVPLLIRERGQHLSSGILARHKRVLSLEQGVAHGWNFIF